MNRQHDLPRPLLRSRQLVDRALAPLAVDSRAALSYPQPAAVLAILQFHSNLPLLFAFLSVVHHASKDLYDPPVASKPRKPPPQSRKPKQRALRRSPTLAGTERRARCFYDDL